MKILKSILSVVAAATIVACGHDVDDYQTNNRMVEVGFSMPVAVDQRTTIGEDGKTTHWEAGDKVALCLRKPLFVAECPAYFLGLFFCRVDDVVVVAHILK